MNRLILAMALVMVAPAAQAKDVAVSSQINPNAELAASSIAVEVTGGTQVLWRGSLRIGGNYGNANFSQSKSEFGDACPGQPANPNQSRNSNEQLSFNLNRTNWQQNPDGFAVNVNWVRPITPCDGEGTTTVGFNRNITLALGQVFEIDGGNGLRVKLTRQR